MDDALPRRRVEPWSGHSGLALAEALSEAADRDVAQRNALARALSAADAAEAACAQEAARRAEAEAWLAAIRRSSTWRMTAPLRLAAERFPLLARPVARALRGAANSLRRPPSRTAPPRETAWRPTDVAAVIDLPQPMPEAGPTVVTLPPPSDAPVLSVIVPSFAQAGYTRRCLAALAASDPIDMEVIVSDDASGDPATAALAEIEHLRLILLPENLGFVRNCNAAAATARGEYLLFLNNDTEVAAGALAAMLDVAATEPRAGIVGAKLIFPDGTLQEAGGIVWRDGSAWNVGRGGDPSAPDFNYRRDTDYVSGAALLIRRDLFAELGGFDEAFAPAYCEDSDLAFRVRARGLRVIYQPEAVVIHHEGVSNGTDVREGMKAYQVRNTKLLRDRWSRTLSREHEVPGGHPMRARDRAMARRVVLVVDHYVPQPDRDAGSRTLLAFLRTMRAVGWIVKFRPDNGLYDPDYAPALERAGIEVLHGPTVGSLSAWLRVHGMEIDAVLLSRPYVAAGVLPGVRSLTRAPVIFYGHDLHHARLRTQAERGDTAVLAEAVWMESLERDVWRSADLVLYPSEEEAAEVRRIEPDACARAVLPYAFGSFPRRACAPEGACVLFVAGFAHPPNVDAATWLMREIVPLVRARHPEVDVCLAGSSPTDPVRLLSREGATVTGFVTDQQLAALYARARVAVVPLRMGAGVKMKVVEGMHAGVPVVTTPVGAQGLPGLGEVARVTEDAAVFAGHILDLLDDDAAWLAQSRRQTDYVAERFSEDAMKTSLLGAFDAAVARRAPR